MNMILFYRSSTTVELQRGEGRPPTGGQIKISKTPSGGCGRNYIFSRKTSAGKFGSISFLDSLKGFSLNWGNKYFIDTDDN